MTIEFRCPNCQKVLRTSDDKAGRMAKCPDCGNQIQVPAAPTEFGAFDDDSPDDEIAARQPPARVAAPGAFASDTKLCPMCGETIKAAATRCRYCGEEIGGSTGTMAPGGYQKPHRGTLVLVFSILGWAICFIFGIVGFVMANQDLNEMKAGIMDPSGESITKAAKIVSLVQMCFMAFAIVVWVIIVVVTVISGGR